MTCQEDHWLYSCLEVVHSRIFEGEFGFLHLSGDKAFCSVQQGFLQLDDIGSQHESHLRIIGDFKRVITFTCFKKRLKHASCSHYTNTIKRERESPAYPRKKNVF